MTSGESQSEEDRSFQGSLLLGVLSLLLLGPITIAGFTLMLAAGAAAFFGLEIDWLSASTPLDFLYRQPGEAGSGDLVQYIEFVGGGVVGSASGRAILWAFTGR